MPSLSPAVKLWLCPQPVDMRLGFDGLFTLVQSRLLADPLSRHLFIFRNRTADHHEQILHSRVLHGDDTGVKLRVVGARKTHKAHLWVYIGDADYPYVVFDFTADYKATGPEHFLESYRGYLQADALAQYEAVYGEDKIQAEALAGGAQGEGAAPIGPGRGSGLCLEQLGGVGALPGARIPGH